MDEFSNKLLSILRDVHHSQKFAESKNAVLLAFCGAGITGTIDILTEGNKIPKSLHFGLSLTVIFLCVSSIVCSLSFIPKINVERILWMRTKPHKSSKLFRKNTDNFYYFGHLQKYSPNELLNAINDSYFESKINRNYKKEYKDIAEQIAINSEITSRKFKIFTYSIYFLICSILVIPVPIIMSLVVFRRF